MKRILVILLMVLLGQAFGHDLPGQLPAPSSTGDAWNVIEESSANVDKLFAGQLLRDVTFQIANIETSLQFLSAQSDQVKVKELSDVLLKGGAEIAVSIRDREDFAKTQARWHAWRAELASLESLYDPKIVHAAVYICSMHPLDRHLSADEKCSVCSMSLIRRHLPASSVYEKPGDPTMKLAVVAPPLVVGKLADVKVRMSRLDGSAILLSDLVEVHTQKIHLLINEASLSDYHHEHPKPTNVPGEYAFSFTPAMPGPYRIWADVVPANSSVQEYVIGDIPAESEPQPLSDRATVLSASVHGRTYKLTLNDNGQPIRAGQTVIGAIEISDADGKPFTKLEPIMGTFAHIVGFSEDRKTVVHIHPYGQSPKSPDDRGGPAFAFKLYVPSPGFLRLYAQVQIDGVSEFAPFGLTIAPAQAATQP